MTYREIIMTVKQQSDELIKNLLSEITELTRHHYIAEQQARYLKESKENLQSDQCIDLADFSDNCSFILQGAIQGLH
jgi:hypothetical protein